MEVFSLLKLRRSGDDPIAPTANACASDICCSAGPNHGGGGGIDDEGPFFDLEFSVPVELKMNASSMCNRSSTSSTSLKEEIFFNGRLFSLESSSSSPSSLFFSPAASEPSSKPHFPASVVKSATKLRIFMFRLNSSNSSSNSASDSVKFFKEEKKLVYKDVILRYISKIKPLYVKVSKLRFSGPLGPNKDGSAAQSTGAKKQSKGKPWSTGNSLSFRLKAVPGRLRKSRSASSAVAYVYPPPMVTPKHDDSLLQQEDGIQGAIAHCKRSFHSEKASGFWAAESPLLRSMSDPGEDRSIARVRDNSAIN